MAEKVLKTKIALLYKTSAEWKAIENEYKPLEGEVCFCEVPGTSEENYAVMFKVGNGEDFFKDLPWGSALAADVFAWAKKANLEFSDLSPKFKQDLLDFVEGGGEANAYRLAQTDNNVVVLQKLVSTSEGDVWEEVEGSAEADLGALEDLIKAEENRAKAAESLLEEAVNDIETLVDNFEAVDVGFDPEGTTMTSTDVQSALLEAWAAIGSGGTSAVVNVVAKDTPDIGNVATYQVTQGGEVVGVPINIPESPKAPREPEIIDGDLYANGIAVRIVDDGTQNVAHFRTAHNEDHSLPFAYNKSVYGGGYGEDVDTAFSFDSSSIVIDGAKLRTVCGGCYQYGDVGVANIVMLNGTITNGLMGGANGRGGANANVGESNIKVYDGSIYLLYGGPASNTAVGKVNMDVYGGDIEYLTVGGSNGETLIGRLNVEGGDINVLQTVNRGYMEDADVTINGGTIARMYAGGEANDAGVTGKAERVKLHLLGGNLSLYPGKYDGQEDAGGARCSGDYNTGVVTIAEAAACNLSENCLILNCNL